MTIQDSLEFMGEKELGIIIWSPILLWTCGLGHKLKTETFWIGKLPK